MGIGFGMNRISGILCLVVLGFCINTGLAAGSNPKVPANLSAGTSAQAEALEKTDVSAEALAKADSLYAAKQYTQAGYPWFDYYDKEQTALDGSKTLAGLKSVKERGEEKRTNPLPENESVSITNLVNLRSGLQPHQVRESDFN